MHHNAACEHCGAHSWSYSPKGARRCVACSNVNPAQQTEFSGETLTDGISYYIIVRAENGAAGYTSQWRPEQIEDYGLVEVCEMVERAMWRSHRALRKSMEPSR